MFVVYCFVHDVSVHFDKFTVMSLAYGHCWKSVQWRHQAIWLLTGNSKLLVRFKECCSICEPLETMSAEMYILLTVFNGYSATYELSVLVKTLCTFKKYLSMSKAHVSFETLKFTFITLRLQGIFYHCACWNIICSASWNIMQCQMIICTVPVETLYAS